MPRISVILPVYNAENFLNESLESLSNQTFKDFEIIAINDGSTDNSLKILQDYYKRDPRLRIISRENNGLPKTLNEGIELATGEYIARMDSDDICLPQRFEKQLQYIQEKDLDLCGTQIERFGTYQGISNYPIECNDCYLNLLIRNSFAHSSILVKKSVFNNYKYNEKYKYSQDYDLWCKMALDKIRMGNTPEILLKFRFSENQISTSKHKIQLDFAQNIARSYWEKNELCKDIGYPMCLMDSDNNNFNELNDSINSVIKLNKRINTSIYIKNILNYYLFLLLARLSCFGINPIKHFFKNKMILSKKRRLIIKILGMTRFIKFILFLKKRTPESFFIIIRKLFYYLRTKSNL